MGSSVAFLPRPRPLWAGRKPVAQPSKAGRWWCWGADGVVIPRHPHIRRTCVCPNSAFYSLSSGPPPSPQMGWGLAASGPIWCGRRLPR